MLTGIIDRLRAAGLDAFLPGVKTGKCSARYYVVTDGGRRAVSKNNALRAFYVTAYVPGNQPGTLDSALSLARDAMLGADNLRPAGGDISEPAWDEDTGAIYASIEYTALCAI